MGADYPCKRDVSYRKRCQMCNKTFRNQSCYLHHLKTRMCKLYHKCVDCGVAYNVDFVKRRSPSGQHECDYKFCNFCFGYHKADRECYIQPLKPPKDKKDVRFVAFDFECTQSTETSPHRFEHQVNFVCAQIFCTKCIRDGKWNDMSFDNRSRHTASGLHPMAS
ncbi:hypothetical protein AAVH_14816 [Aphelenchoides avenae]|nr:hypothetical protein AAVH_14816 [Aphelenchus avenae]